MYQRDYLLRMIQEMTTLIARTLGLREQKEKKELLQEWEELLDRRFRMTSMLAESLRIEDLMRMFNRHGRIQADELQAFAVILLERADLERDIGLDAGQRRDEVQAVYIQRIMKGYELLLEAMLHDSDRRLLPVMEQANKVTQELRVYKLPLSLLERIWLWHDRDGRYAEAENACYDWINTEPHSDTERKQAALIWYRKLLEVGEEQLEAGGLSREEVEQAVDELTVQLNAGVSETS